MQEVNPEKGFVDRDSRPPERKLLWALVPFAVVADVVLVPAYVLYHWIKSGGQLVF